MEEAEGGTGGKFEGWKRTSSGFRRILAEKPAGNSRGGRGRRPASGESSVSCGVVFVSAVGPTACLTLRGLGEPRYPNLSGGGRFRKTLESPWSGARGPQQHIGRLLKPFAQSAKWRGERICCGTTDTRGLRKRLHAILGITARTMARAALGWEIEDGRGPTEKRRKLARNLERVAFVRFFRITRDFLWRLLRGIQFNSPDSPAGPGGNTGPRKGEHRRPDWARAATGNRRQLDSENGKGGSEILKH